MKSIIYIGMDVHKKTYSLCALLKETGEIIGETKIPADVSLIIKFIENAKKSVDSDDVQIKTGYEAGCLGYSLYWQLAGTTSRKSTSQTEISSLIQLLFT